MIRNFFNTSRRCLRLIYELSLIQWMRRKQLQNTIALIQAFAIIIPTTSRSEMNELWCVLLGVFFLSQVFSIFQSICYFLEYLSSYYAFLLLGNKFDSLSLFPLLKNRRQFSKIQKSINQAGKFCASCTTTDNLCPKLSSGWFCSSNSTY